jgi:hypothetical protein
VRFLQNTLLVIGAMAVGAISCGPGLFLLMAATIWRRRTAEDWGAGVVAIPLLSCGALMGAMVGLVAAWRWIATRNGGLWTSRIWIGIAAGSAVALLLYFANALPGYGTLGGLLQSWPVAAVLIPALGMLGGIVAAFAGSPWHHHDSRGRRKRKPRD